MSEGQMVALGDHLDILTGFPFTSRDYTDEGVRLLRGDNVAQGNLRWEAAKYWPNHLLADVDPFMLAVGDVVLAMDRPWIGAGLKYAHLRQGDVPCLLVQRVARLRSRDGLDQNFLRVLVGSPAFTDHVLSVQTGTAVPHISAPQIREFKFSLPPLHEQRAVAEVLGALDDKIDANEELIRRTEALLRAMFGQLLEGEGPGTDSSFGEVCCNIRESVDPTGLDASTPCVGLEHMPRGSVVLRSWGAAADVLSGKATFQSRDILFGKLRPYFRKVVLAEASGICSSDILVLRVRRAPMLPFVLMLASSQEFIDYCDSVSAGTRMPRVSWTDMERYPVKVPNEEVLAGFSEVAAPLLDRMAVAARESLRLSELRDALLPPLMSGWIRVRDAEAVGI